MPKITLEIPATTPLVEIQQLAHRIGGVLRFVAPGEYAIRERHTNANVVRMTHYRGQYRGANLPTVPDAG